METKKISNEMRAELRKPLPQEAFSVNSAKSFLTSINPIYVIERLNDVFGVGSWNFTPSTESLNIETGMVVVRGVFTIPEYGVSVVTFGGNDNGGASKKGFDLGDAFKGASTDALTKAASYLEICIDVYKNKQNEKKSPSQPETPQKEWLNPNTKKWTEAVAYLTANKSNFAKVKEKYNISAPNEEKLKNECGIS